MFRAEKGQRLKISVVNYLEQEMVTEIEKTILEKLLLSVAF